MNKLAKPAPILELYNPGDLGEQSIVLTDSDVQAGFELGSPLPHDDRPAIHQLPGETLDTKPLGLAVSSVSGASDSLFMCHTDLYLFVLLQPVRSLPPGFFQCGRL
jgi:hypothetical protein